MSERREESREANDKLWDKKFADSEDLGSDGHLSRTEHRRQREHNSTITTVLIVLIIILFKNCLILNISAHLLQAIWLKQARIHTQAQKKFINISNKIPNHSASTFMT